jgi:hypothetical protein
VIEIPLTKGYVALIDEEDYPAVSRHSWHATECRGGLVYAATRTNGRIAYLHRMLAATPELPWVDHANGNGLDNRRANLRPCTQSQNAANARTRRGTSRFRGVWWNKGCGKWQVVIKANGCRRYLGVFHSEEEAARAYDVAALAEFGEFARLNLPDRAS